MLPELANQPTRSFFFLLPSSFLLLSSFLLPSFFFLDVWSWFRERHQHRGGKEAERRERSKERRRDRDRKERDRKERDRKERDHKERDRKERDRKTSHHHHHHHRSDSTRKSSSSSSRRDAERRDAAAAVDKSHLWRRPSQKPQLVQYLKRFSDRLLYDDDRDVTTQVAIFLSFLPFLVLDWEESDVV